MRVQGLLVATLVLACAATSAAAAENGTAPPRPDPVTVPEWVDVAPQPDAWKEMRAFLALDGAAPTPAPCRPPPEPCAWRVDVTVLAWIMGVNGGVRARDVEADVDVTPADAIGLIDVFEMLFSGVVRVSHGDWNARVGTYYIRAGDSIDLTKRLEPDVTYEQWIVEASVGYRVAKVPLSCGPCAPTMSVSPFVGARYESVALDVEGPLVDARQERGWLDPLVGVELEFDFANRWWGRIQGDVGGFGIRGDADFTWSLRGEVGYQFSPHVGALLGIAALGGDHEDGSFAWNLTQYGPYIGVRFTF